MENENVETKSKKSKSWGFALIGLLITCMLATFVISKSKTVIEPAKRGVKTVWGEIVPKTYAPGLVWNYPFMEEWGCKTLIFDISSQNYEYSYSNVRTKDLQNITFNCAINVEPVDTNVHQLIDKYPGGYPEYKEKVLNNLVNSVVNALVGQTDVWLFIGRQNEIVKEAIAYVVGDNLVQHNYVRVSSVRLLGFEASAEFEKMVDETAQAKQGIILESYKADRAEQATRRAIEEAKQAYEFMANEAKVRGLSLEFEATYVRNPLIVQYEIAKAINRWNGDLTLPSTLTLMQGGDTGNPTVFPFLPLNLSNKTK